MPSTAPPETAMMSTPNAVPSQRPTTPPPVTSQNTLQHTAPMMSTNLPASDCPANPASAPPKRKPIISFKQRMEVNEAKSLQHAGEPDNWISRKFMVGVVLALIAWSYYVVVGRVCTPMIRKTSGAGGSRGEGVGLLIGYNILWLMFMWTYLKLILTDPGWAKDVAQPGQQMTTPPFESVNGLHATEDSSPHPPLSIPHSEQPVSQRDPRFVTMGTSPSSVAGMYSISDDDDDDSEDQVADHAGNFDGFRNMLPSDLPVPFSLNEHEHDMEPRPSQGNTITSSSHTQVESFAHLAPTAAKLTSEPRTGDHGAGCCSNDRPQLKPEELEWPFPNTKLGQAYCNHCNIWKPDRAHHCRHCGTCVLAMDHHCPWIGQCVGWKNRKFFINFLVWCTSFTVYIIAVLVANLTTRARVDPQMIVLAGITGFFALFTVMMAISQLQLLASSLTTIESFSIRSQRDRERATLSRLGFCAFRDKMQTKRRWEKEWGDFGTEGNRWWVGPASREIKQTMGDDPLGWIFPIGRPQGDGVTYEQNPRFGPGGIRRRRDEWLEGLR